MSSFNILNTIVKCIKCNQEYEAEIQFKFGDVWQHEYKIGDQILWGGNDIGFPNLKQVKVYGVLSKAKCQTCSNETTDEFDIFIESDVINNISPILNGKEYLKGDGNFLIIKE